MKKLLLLMAAGLVAAHTDAQTNAKSVVRVGGLNAEQQTHLNDGRQRALPLRTHVANTANKTTGPGGSRWYNYVDHMALLDPNVTNNLQLPYMWFRPDMYGIYGATGGGVEADTIEFVSYAMTFDPISDNQSDFNDPFAYPSDIAVTSTNAYTLDSVRVWGVYGRNPNKPTIVDTLRFSFVYGNGGTSNMPMYYFDGMGANFPGNDTVRFAGIGHNPATNTALKYGTPSVIVVDKYLDSLSVNDTSADGWSVFEVAAGMSVPANNLVGATVTFKSGESYVPFSDTVFRGSVNPDVPFKFGLFRPMMVEQNDGGYLTYTPGNWNMGHVKFMPESPSWDSLYVPAVAYTAPFAYEFPYMDFKVSCANCDMTVGIAKVNNVISKVGNAYPNPATTSVTIPFHLSETATVNVTLSNTLGQVVKTQNLGKVSSGNAVINTADLSSGVYFYTVEANGERITKRLVVTH